MPVRIPPSAWPTTQVATASTTASAVVPRATARGRYTPMATTASAVASSADASSPCPASKVAAPCPIARSQPGSPAVIAETVLAIACGARLAGWTAK